MMIDIYHIHDHTYFIAAVNEPTWLNKNGQWTGLTSANINITSYKSYREAVRTLKKYYKVRKLEQTHKGFIRLKIV